MPTTHEIAIKFKADLAGFNKGLSQAETQVLDLQKSVDQLYTRSIKGEEEVAKARKRFDSEWAKQEKSKTDTVIKEEMARVRAVEQGAQKGAQARLTAEQEIKRGIQDSAKATLAAQVALNAETAKGSAANAKNERKLAEQLALAKAAAARDEIKVTEDVYRRRKMLAAGNVQEILRLEEERIRKIAALEARAGSAQQQANRTRSGGSFSNLMRRREEAAEAAGVASGALTSMSNVAGVAGLAFGPVGGVIGVAFDALKMFTTGLVNLGEKAIETENKFHALTAVIQLNNANIGVAQLTQIRTQLDAIVRPVGLSRDGLYELSQAVAGFADPGQIAEVTNHVLTLSRIEPGMNLRTLSQDLADLESTTGGFGEAADLAATLANSLRGDSIAPLGDAIKGLTPIINDAKILIRDQGQASKEAAILMSALVKTEMSAGEASSGAAKLFDGLNKALNNPTTMNTLTKALPEGLSLTEIGLEKGNVSVVKFIEEMQKLGPQANAVGEILGPKLGGESISALVAAFQSGNNALAEATAEFENVEGAAARTAAALISPAQRAKEMHDQMASDAFDNFSRSLMSVAEGAMEAGTALLSGIASPGFASSMREIPVIGGFLESIGDLFFDSSVTAERAATAYKAASDSLDAFSAINTDLQSAQGEDFTAQLNANMQAISASAADGGAEIRALVATMGEPGTATYAANIEKIKGQLNEIQELKVSQEFAAITEAMDAAQEAMQDVAESSDSWLQSLAKGAASFFGVSDEVLANVDALNTSFAEARESATANLEEIRARIAELKSQGVTQAGGSEEAQELRDLYGDLADAQLDLAKTREDENVALQKSLDMAKMLADATKEESMGLESVEEQRSVIMAKISESLGNQPELIAKVGAEVDKLLAGEELVVDAAGQVTEQVEEQAEAQADVNAQVVQQEQLLSETQALVEKRLATAKELGAEEKLSSEAKIALREEEKAKNSALIEQLEVQMGLVDYALSSEEAILEVKGKIAAQQKNINDLKAAEVSGAEVAAIDVAALGSGGREQLQQFRAQLAGQIESLREANESIDRGIAEIREEDAAAAEDQREKDEAAAEKLRKEAEDAAKKAQAEKEKADKERFDRQQSANEEFERLAREELAAREAYNAEVEKAASAIKGAFSSITEQAREQVLGFEATEDTGLLARFRQIPTFASEAAEVGLELRKETEALADTARASRDAVLLLQRQIAGTVAGSPENREFFGGMTNAEILRDLRHPDFERESMNSTGDIFTVDAEMIRLRQELLSADLKLAEAERAYEAATSETAEAERLRSHVNAALNEQMANNAARLELLKEGYAEYNRVFLELMNAPESEQGRLREELAAVTTEVVAMERAIKPAMDITKELFDRNQGALSEEQVADFTLAWQHLNGQIVEMNEGMALAAATSHELLGTVSEIAATTTGLKTMQDVLDRIGALAGDAGLPTVARTLQNISASLNQIEAARLNLATKKSILETLIADNPAMAEAYSDQLAEINRQMRDLAQAESTIRKSTAQLVKDTKNAKVEENIQKALDHLGKALDLVNATVGFIDTIRKAESGMDVAEGAIDLTQQVGQALLSSGVPGLNVVGAFIVGGAMIAKAISGIVKLFSNEKLSPEARAEREAEAVERTMAMFEKRKALMEAEIALGDVRYDQAREQLEFQKQLNDQLLRELGIREGIMTQLLSNPDFVRQQREQNQAAQSDIEKTIAEAEDALETGSGMKRFLREHGRSTAGLPRAQIKKFLEELRAELTRLQSESGVLDQVAAGFETIASLERQMLEDEIRLNELRTRLGEDELTMLRKTQRQRREALEEALAAAGIEIRGLTDEQAKEVLRQQAALLDEQISGPIAELAAQWLDAADAADEYANAAKEVNEELAESDRLLVELVRKRQDAIRLARQTGDYAGTTTLTNQIAQHLRSQGKSEEEISAFLATLPQFAEGGPTGLGGPVMTHPGEWILNADAVNHIGQSALDQLNRNAAFWDSKFGIGSMTPDRFLGNAIQQREQSGRGAGTVINLTVNVNLPPGSTQSQAQAVASAAGDALADKVNTLIQSGRVRLDR